MSYDQITETRRLTGAMWKLLFGAGVVIALVSIWQPQLGFASVVLGLLGTHAATADILLGRIARLQAAVDMKRIMLGRDLDRGEVMNMLAATEFGQGGVIYLTHTACTIERVQ